MSYQRPNNRGLFLGRVDEVRDGAAYLKAQQPLAEGDLEWAGCVTVCGRLGREL